MKSWRGMGKLLLFEYLVGEFYHTRAKERGDEQAQRDVLTVKGLQGSQLREPDDRDAIRAGAWRLRYARHDLSLVDSFLLVLAKRHGTRVFTTDPGVRTAGKELGIELKFVPRLLAF